MELEDDQVELSMAAQKPENSGNGFPGDAEYYSEPAREQRLNLLLHLIHYADLLILTSVSGSGKTTLLQKFSQRMGDDWQIHQLQGAALAQETSLSNRLADIFGSAGDGHEDRVEHLINHIPRLRRLSKPIVIIIDDAEKLTFASMQLLDKMLAAGDNYGKPVHIVLAGTAQLEEALTLPELSRLQERVAHRLDIPALSESHGIEFINNFVKHVFPDKQNVIEDSEAKKIIRLAEGQPGPIIEGIKEPLESPKDTSPSEKTSSNSFELPLLELDSEKKKFTSYFSFLSSKPMIFGAIALGVALSVMGLLRLGGSGETNQVSVPLEVDLTESAEESVEQNVAANEPDRARVNELINSTAEQPPAATDEPVIEEAPPADVIVEASNNEIVNSSLPKVVQDPVQETEATTPVEVEQSVAASIDTVEEAVTELAPEPEQVDVTSAEEPVQNPAQNTVNGSAEPTQDEILEEVVAQAPNPPATGEVVTAENESVVASAEEVAAVASSEEASQPDQATQNIVEASDAAPSSSDTNGIKREQWLLEQNPDHFTLQLTAANNEPGIIKFIEDRDIAQSSAYFFSRRDGNPWYAVTYGSYASRAEANSVQLPSSLRGVKPWVRSFGGIQNAIKATR